MAVVTQIASGAAVADAATVWDTGAVPAIGDTVDATGNFDLTWDDDSNALGAFYRQGSTGTLTIANGKTLDIDGICALDGPVAGPGTVAVSGDFLKEIGAVFSADLQLLLDGTGYITDNSTASGGADTEINTAGTVTQTTDFDTLDYTLTAGTFDANGYTLNISGNVLYSGGTVTEFNPNLIGTTKTIAWNSYGNPITLLTIDSGATITTAAAVWTKALAGTGAFTVNNPTYIYQEASGWWNFTGMMTGAGALYFNNVDASPGPVPVDIDVKLYVQSSTNQSLTMGAGLNIGTRKLHVRGVGAADTMTLNMGANSLVAGQVELGNAGAIADGGILNLGTGAHSIASLATGNAANTLNAIDFDQSTANCTGAMNLDNIQATGATPINARIVFGPGGVMSNIDDKGLTNPIAVWGDASVLGAGMTDVQIANYVNAQSYPGSLAMMGIGGGHVAVSV
jgi:hypothetical protein